MVDIDNNSVGSYINDTGNPKSSSTDNNEYSSNSSKQKSYKREEYKIYKDAIIDILKQVYPKINDYVKDDNNINLEKLFKERFSKSKTIDDNTLDDLYDIFKNIVKDGSISDYFPEILNYIDSNREIIKNKSSLSILNKIVEVFEQDDMYIKTKNTTTLFQETCDVKSLKDLFSDLYNFLYLNNKSLELNKTLNGIYDRLIVCLHENKSQISLRLIPHFKNILTLETIEKSTIIDIYETVDNRFKSKYDLLIIDNILNLLNMGIISYRTHDYSHFNVINNLKNIKMDINSKGALNFLHQNSNNLLNKNIPNSNLILIASDYMLNSIMKAKKMKNDATKGIIFSTLLSLMEPTTFNRFAYTVQRDIVKGNNPLAVYIKDVLFIPNTNQDDKVAGSRIRNRVGRNSYSVPIRKKVIKDLLTYLESNYDISKHLELAMKAIKSNISTKTIIQQ